MIEKLYSDRDKREHVTQIEKHITIERPDHAKEVSVNKSTIQEIPIDTDKKNKEVHEKKQSKTTSRKPKKVSSKSHKPTVEGIQA